MGFYYEGELVGFDEESANAWPMMLGGGLCGPPIGPQPPEYCDLARWVRQHFKHLVTEGFTEEQAIELCSSYQATVMAFGRS